MRKLSFVKSSYLVWKVKQNQHWKEMTATSMKDVLNRVLSDLCEIQGRQNVFGPLECTQKQLYTSLATASVITWAFADTAGQPGLESQSLDGMYI